MLEGHAEAAVERAGARVPWLLVALVLLTTAPVVQYLLDQQQSRIALTAAVWDQGTVRLDEYTHVLGVDRAERDGHTYSDKAPGQPLLSVPFYALYRAVGGEPATVPRQRGNLGVWWLSLWTAAVPAAILAVLMRGRAATVAPRHATAAAVAVGFGTLLLPFSTLLFGHLLSALLGYAAYTVADRSRLSRRRLAAAGALAGGAALTEYSLGLLVVILAGWLVGRHRSGVVWFLLGTVPALLLLMLYNTIAFGGPLNLSYQSAVVFGEAHAQGLVGAGLPRPDTLAEVLVGRRGLFTQTPVVLAGVVGLLCLWRRGGRCRGTAVVGLSMFAAFVLLQAGWSNPYGGSSPGPRYVLPALPFLAVGVAVALERWPLVTGASVGFSVLVMSLATYTHPLVGRDDVTGLGRWLDRATRGDFTPTVLSPVMGDAGLLLVLAAVAVAAAVLWRTERRAVARDDRVGEAPNLDGRSGP